MAVLLMRLCGALQSWGTHGEFGYKNTAHEPTKSGVVGLLCAAIGATREDNVARELLNTLRMAVRVDRPGTFQVDFGVAVGVLKIDATENRDPSKMSNEIIQKQFLADADFVVGVQSSDVELLQRLDRALRDPVWPLYLGRKAYTPSLPIWVPGGVRDTDDLVGTLMAVPYRVSRGRVRPERLTVVEEVSRDRGVAVDDVYVGLSHGFRRFTSRHVERRMERLTGTAMPL